MSTASTLKQKFLARFEFGDALLLFYFVAIVRQWFWPLENSLAWILTILIGLALWAYYVSEKDPVTSRPTRSFWLIVGLPLLAAYALRAPFPDSSFDVWALRLIHGDRGLRGFLYLPGEFFPTAAPFNPTPDMVTTIFRYMFGYRLGTVVNLVAMLWTAAVLDRLLRPQIANATRRAIGVLLIVFVEHLLFEINNYMPDLLALPLLLEATRLTIENVAATRRLVVQVAFLIGLAVTLKLSNGAVALPLVLIWIWRCFKTLSFKEILESAGISLVLFVAMLGPFTLWVYRLTGSPIFPLYNKVFRSPLYPPFNGWDNRWGGYGAFEILSWPILMFLEPVRTAELPVYSGRLSVGFLIAVLCLIFARRLGSQIKIISILLVFGTLLWSVTMGYIRYGLYLEVLSGVLLVSLAVHLYRESGNRSLTLKFLASILVLVLLAQSVLAGYYLSHREWSMRPTAFQDFEGYKRESKHLFRDRSVRQLLPPRERELFDGVDLWVVSGAKTAGLMPLLNDKAKIVGVRAGGLFLAPGTREALSRSLDEFRGKRMASLALESDYGEALSALRNVGLGVGQVEEVVIPFYSSENNVPAYFLEVTRQGWTQGPPTKTVANSALGEDALNATIVSQKSLSQFHTGENLRLFFNIKNTSAHIWPSRGQQNDQYQIVLAGRWLALEGDRQVGERVELPFPYDISPDESIVLPLVMKAPDRAGTYVLDVSMDQRGVSSRGTKPLHLTVDVK